MNYLTIAQYMAAATFFTLAMTHLTIWVRVRQETIHLLFAVTAAVAGATALAEVSMYHADSVPAMCSALRWYVAASGCWAIATVSFFAYYGRVGPIGKFCSVGIIVVCCAALIINLFSPTSFIFTEVTGLRKIGLPWGEEFRLAIGKGRPLRLITDIAFLSIFVVVADGCYQLWRRQQRTRAFFFGATVFVFMACFVVHAYYVDIGELDSPYLSTYGFLALVLLMSFELAGEVLRKSELSFELAKKETELHSAVVDERNRIADDLHDSVTQTLFSTAAIADALPDVWQKHPQEAMQGLENLKRLTRGALAEMRTLLLELRPSALVERDLGQLLQQLASATSGRSQIPVEVKAEGQARFPDNVQITLFRVTQESLNNVVKHAQASQAWVELITGKNDTVLTIRDDGRGFDSKNGTPGLGLKIMRERVASIEGQLDLDSISQQGTTITVRWQGNPDRNNNDER